MQRLSATKKARLLAPSTVLFVFAAIIGLLFFLHNDGQAFAPDAGRPDEVSANYSELLLQQKPDDDALRLSLIDVYLGLSKFAQAQHHVHLLQTVSADLRAYYQFKVDAQTALGLGLDKHYAVLRERSHGLSFDRLSAEQQIHLADLALQLNVPSVAAPIYEHLASTHKGQQQLDYFDLSAHWYFAANQYQRSAQLHALLAEKTTGRQRADYQRRVVADYLAANDPVAAVSYLQQLAQQQNLSNEQLLGAVSAALLAEDLRQALYFNTLLIAQAPNLVTARLTEQKISLAMGDIERAWQLRDWLLDHYPNDADVYIQMAELGEWNNASADALTLWMKALDLEHNAEHFEHAWRLAIQIFDFERSLQLLNPIQEQRPLTDIELGAVFYSHESRGTPEQAELWLRNYIVHYPQHRMGWTYLLHVLKNTEQYSQEIAMWSAMAQKFELKPKELIRQIETHLLNYDLDGAWQVFKQSKEEHIADANYWHLKAAVAWALEDDEQFLLVFQQMEQGNIKFARGQLDQTIGLLAQTNPAKALELTLQRWEKKHQEHDLMSAVYLAIGLSDWDTLQALIDTTRNDANLAQSTPIFLARISIAEHQQDHQLAEYLLQQAIGLYPTNNLFREQLLWLYIATNQREPIKALLSKWRGLVENDGRLWLPFAVANQLLNRSTDALLWYQRHIELNPSDWLSKAAFADALDAAEYFEAARLQRQALLNMPLLNTATQAHYRTWLNLLAANYGQKTANAQALAWQDGTQSMLQLWFEQQLLLLSQPQQDQKKTAWLTWAQQNKLIVSDFELIEEALRSFDLSEVQRLLVSQRMPKEQQVAALKALNYRHRAGALALSELGHEYSASRRAQLRRQALAELKAHPQGVQLGWQQRDFGGAVYTGLKLTAARAVNDRWYARMDADQGNLKIEETDTFDFAKELYVQLALNRQLRNGSLDLSINHSSSNIKSRTGVSIARNWQVTQKSRLSVGYDWKDRSDTSSLMYVLGQKNSLWLRGHQQISARDSFSWALEKNDYTTRYNDKLSSGTALELQAVHTVFFEHPTWLVKAGFDYQKNNLNQKALTQLPKNPTNGTSFNTNSLLSEKYKYAYIGTTLQRGMPGFLNRSEPQYTWMLDAVVGRQWPANKMTYSFSAGLGMQVVGDDELAFSLSYQSAPKSQFKSQSGATLGVSYSSRFGR